MLFPGTGSKSNTSTNYQSIFSIQVIILLIALFSYFPIISSTMLCKYRIKLDNMKIILGSQSPRRQQIFRDNLGISSFEVIVSTFAEDIPKSSCSGPIDYVSQTCQMKCKDIITKCQNEMKHLLLPDIIVTADTIVVKENEILEKPRDREHCKWMLNMLSDSMHEVVTAVTIATKISDNEYSLSSFHDITQVYFNKLDNDMIEAYMDTNEPFDKAGGYGIQGLASTFVKRINGCYFNVMGFPVGIFAQHLSKQLSMI